MNEATQTFPYTAKRGAYLSVVLTLLFFMLVEGSVLVLLIVLFVHDDLLKLIVLAALAALLLAMMVGLLLAPLWTKHRLTDTHLHLRYGRDRLEVPRSAIVAARPIHERLNMFQPLRAQVEAQKRRVVACFSEQGQVLLLLDRPHALRVNGTTAQVDQLVFNVDRRDDFLAALGLPGTLTSIDSQQRQDRVQEQAANSAILPVEKKKPTPTEQIAIRVEGLTRRFGASIVVENLSLAIQQGEIYGFLGSNGAGKTTTIRMLVGLLEPSAGRIEIAGHDVWAEPLAAKAALGFVADRSLLYERLTGREFLTFLGQLRSLPASSAQERIQRLLVLLDLTEDADRPCGAYSFGMKRKLSLAGALLHEPPILLLDEPLNGLDPRVARRLKDLLLELAAGGTTILLSTHDLATAETLCHRIGILHKGRLVAEGSTETLRQLAAAPDLEAVFLNLTTAAREEVLV